MSDSYAVSAGLDNGDAVQDNSVVVSDDEEKTGFCAASKDKKGTVVTFCLANFCVGAFYSLLAPFFTTEVNVFCVEKNMFLERKSIFQISILMGDL